jgi:hypothetical protein
MTPRRSAGTIVQMRRARQTLIRSRIMSWGDRHRSLAQIGIDTAAWAVALAFATVVRWNFALGAIDYGGLTAIIP